MLDADSIIMVIGVGGAGGNAVNHMQQMGIHGVNFVVCNTDEAALNNSPVQNKIVLGPGRGAGNKPEIGRKYAIESEDKLRSLLETSGVKMLFIAAGMGGGTGTGASPVIANIAHDLGILTVAVVTMPFRMEGPKRYQYATEGIEELHKWVDSLLIIDNERLRKLYGKLPIKDAFGKADDVLGMATKGIAELITVEYALVRVDFADVETVMRGSGRAHMSVVSASGDNRALQVAEGALSSSLLDDNHISGAKEILLSFSVSDIDKLTHDDVTDAMSYIQEHASYVDEDGNTHQANIIWGASEKKSLADDELELVVVATRFEDGNELNLEAYSPEVDPNVFGTQNPEPVVDDIKPRMERQEIHRRPSEGPTIQPPQDKYKLVRMQQVEPAYTRQKQQFVAESDTHTKTTFRPIVSRVEEVEPQSYDMFS
ncbi:MAG: cell division protein FtsZ [Alistipes sp.]|nr:cell division protein FtsZ [Alistipes sp.]MBO7265947.1 cell division protein FtsZ [Alistipes sp.]